MKITAGQPLVAFGEMKIDRADETGERTNDPKGKERDNGLRKYAGHLVVPKWKSRKVSTSNLTLLGQSMRKFISCEWWLTFAEPVQETSQISFSRTIR